MNRLLVWPHELDSTGRARLTGRRAQHLLKVLHGLPGQEVRMGVINGPCGTGRILETDGDRVDLEWTPGEPPPLPRADLLLAMPRPKVMKRLWAPLAAMGVGRIVILNASKVERVYFDTHWLDPKHYTPLLIEGLEQAGDTRLPDVLIRRRFRPFVEDELDALFPGGARWVGQPSADAPAPCSATAGSRFLAAVGPEGGWTEFDLALLRKHRFQPLSLGPRTLRTDTACIALLAVGGRLA